MACTRRAAGTGHRFFCIANADIHSGRIANPAERKYNIRKMSKKKSKNPGEINLEDFKALLDDLQNMSDKDLEQIKEFAQQFTDGNDDSNDPNTLNALYYGYEGPEQYNTGSKRIAPWLKPMWKADHEDSWLQLCHDTAEAGKDLTDKTRSRDIRKYIYMLIDNFYEHDDIEQDAIRLIGPLWLIEHYKLTDCLDLVLELLRQEAWFYTAFIDSAPQCLSAVLYQIGHDQTELLRDMLYESGLIPLIKPIVFNALVWTALRIPQKRLSAVSTISTYLNHSLNICREGASARNIPKYAYALAYAHIHEVRSILKRLFTEIDELDIDTFHEVESIYDDPIDHFDGFLFDSVEGYLQNQEEQDAYRNFEDWVNDEDEDWEEEDEEEGYASICDYNKQQKRYTVHIELLDAPEQVERTLQVPSNLRLSALAELAMLAFGRKDTPEQFVYQVRDELYPDSSCHGFTLGDLLKKKNETARFNILNKLSGSFWRHGIVLEKSAEYSDRTNRYINLLDGRGTYPSKSTLDMDAHCQRFIDGKLRKPNFKSIRKNIHEFEKSNMPF